MRVGCALVGSTTTHRWGILLEKMPHTTSVAHSDRKPNSMRTPPEIQSEQPRSASTYWVMMLLRIGRPAWVRTSARIMLVGSKTVPNPCSPSTRRSRRSRRTFPPIPTAKRTRRASSRRACMAHPVSPPKVSHKDVGKKRGWTPASSRVKKIWIGGCSRRCIA